MRVYRGVWSALCWGFAALGAAVGLLAPAAVLVPSLFLTQTLAGLGYLAVRQHHKAGRGSARGLLRCALGSAVGLLVLAGLLRVLGITAVPLLALLAAGHPQLVAAYAHAGRPDRQPDGPAAARPPAAAGRAVPAPEQQQLRELTTEQLCRQWRASHFLPASALGLAEQAALAQLRQGYLDELERRDPAGFASWLAAGARAGSDPRRYLTADTARTDTS